MTSMPVRFIRRIGAGVRDALNRVVLEDDNGNVISSDNPLPVEETIRTIPPEPFEDTNFVAGDSPASLNCNTALGRNATQFTIINDGIGNFTVAISNDGVSFGGEHTTKNGETYELKRLSTHTIRITHVADSSYRVIVV